jgi:ketosteroid isomerase-like protein
MKTSAAFAAALALASCAHLPSAREAAESLAAAETQFAAHSVREDMRAAFMAHFAEEGLFVRDGWTPAPAWLASRPAPPIVLDWRPAYVEVARSGEMGLSTGPWKITSRATPDRPPAYGQFVSIWKRVDGGPWKVAVDLGISHPAPTYWDTPLEIAAASLPHDDAGTLATAEGAFARDSAAFGEREAVRRHGSATLRHYREGAPPHADLARALASPALGDMNIAWHAERSETARSGDFGYVIGRYSPAADPSATLGHYLRVWRRERGVWKVSLDVVNPVPKR